MTGRRLRGLAAVLALVLGLGAAWSAAVLLAVRGDLTDARAALTAAREQPEDDRLADVLARAEADLDRAAGLLGQPGPAGFARVPLAGRTVAAVRVTTEAARSAVRAARDLLAVVEAEQLVRAGGVDPAALEQVADVLERGAADAAGPVADLLAQPAGLLPGSVAEALRAAQAELALLPADLRRAAAAVRALRGVVGADRPRNLLVVLDNNAELRGTGGVVSVFAEAVARAGRVQVGAFRDVEEVADRPAEVTRVAAPADYRALWGRYLADSTLWKNTNMSPDGPTSSAVLAAVAEASLGRRPDVVVRLDVRAIAAVLGATGPAVLADGTEVTQESTVERLLVRAYAAAPDDRLGQKARRAALRGVADAVLQRLLGGGGVSAVDLGAALAQTARGRHLTVWSADPAEQAALVAGGLGGELRAGEGDLAAVTLQNFGGGGGEGNKLDVYGRRQHSVRVTVGLDRALVEQEISLRNAAPARGLPAYVAGLRTPGVANGLVTVALPRGAALLGFTREGAPVRTGRLDEGDHQVLTDTVSLPPGTTATWVLRYELPVVDGRYALTAVPQPLAVDAGLALDLRADDGLRLRAVRGVEQDGGAAAGRSGAFAETVEVVVEVARPGVVRRSLDRVRRFWSGTL